MDRSAITRRQHLAAIVLFGLVIVLAFYRAIFFGEILAPLDLLTKELPWRGVLPTGAPVSNFMMADVFETFYPWKHFVHDELRAGRFPLWCTHVGCGYPLAGVGVIKLFGLTTAFLMVSTPQVASILTFSTQLFIAMTGMYTSLCSLRLRWAAAVFGAVTYGLSSSLFQYLEFEHITGGLMMLPWICWALWRAAGQLRWVAIAGLFWGLTIIHGSPQGTAMVWFSAVGVATAVFWRQGRGKFLLVVIGFSALGVIVGGIALLPNLELITLNTRQRFGVVHWWEMIWKRPLMLIPWLASTINPDALGNTRTFDVMRGLGRVGMYGNTATMLDVRVYCGLVGLMLAAWGLRAKQEARRLGIVLVAVPLFVVIISPMYLIVYFRYLLAASAGIAVLAAVGVQRVLDRDPRLAADVRKTAITLLAALGLAVTAGIVTSVNREQLTRKVEQVGMQRTSTYKFDTVWQQQKARATVDNYCWRGPAILRFSALAALVVLLLPLATRQPSLAVAVLFIVNAGDLIELQWRSLPSTPSKFDYPETPALEFLRRQPGTFRVCSSWNHAIEPSTAQPNLLVVYKLDDPRVYEALIPKNPLLADQDWTALGVKFFIVPPDSKPPQADWPRVFHGEVDIYENINAAPRVSFIGGPAQINIEHYVSGHILVAVDAAQAGRLIVRERLYPGWRATVNGQPTELREADGLWQSVPVPAGQSRVALEFRPCSVYVGAALTGLGLVLVGAAFVYGAKNRDPAGQI